MVHHDLRIITKVRKVRVWLGVYYFFDKLLNRIYGVGGVRYLRYAATR